MGCAESSVMRLPNNYNQAARSTLAHHSRSTCGPGRRFAGHSPDTRRSTSDRVSEVLRRVSGEATARLRRDWRSVSRNAPGAWRWVRGQSLAFWGRDPNIQQPTCNIQHQTGREKPHGVQRGCRDWWTPNSERRTPNFEPLKARRSRCGGKTETRKHAGPETTDY